MQKDKILRYYNCIKQHKKDKSKKKMVSFDSGGKQPSICLLLASFDWGGRSLQFAFGWPPSIGADNSKVTSFDWALAEAKSCPSIGQRQGGSVLRLGVRTSEFLSFD